MRAIITLAVVLCCCSPSQAQYIGLSDRAPELEQGNAIWDSTVTVGPALIRWKVLTQTWEQYGHCVEIVFDAPGVVSAVYHVERVYADGATTTTGPHGDLTLTLPAGWMHDLDAMITGADPRVNAAELSREKLKQCVMQSPRVLPSEVRVVLTSVEMDDGRVFGDPEVLKDRREGQIAFRKTLQYLDQIIRQTAPLSGMDGFLKLRECLSQEDSENRFPSVPPLRQHLRDWMDGILIGDPLLHFTPEELLPGLQELGRRYLDRVEKQLAGSNGQSGH